MNLLRLALFVLITQAATAPQPQSAMIEGTVVDSATGKPIAGATVSLSNSSEPLAPPASEVVVSLPSPALSGIATADGKFTIDGLQPGNYSAVIAKAPGYVDGNCGVRMPVLVPGQKWNGIRCELTPTGTITGRVVDRNGDPVSNAVVQALQFGFVNGQKTLNVKASILTNDLGEYRLFWLNPGRYYIREDNAPSITVVAVAGFATSIVRVLSSPENLIRRIASDGSIQDEMILPVFYPDTVDSQQATPVEVRSGTIISVDLKTVPTRVHRIRGRIAGAPSIAAQRTALRLNPHTTVVISDPFNITLPSSANSIIAKPDNTFEIVGVRPGSYDLIATSNTSSGTMPIEVRDSDLNNVVLAVEPAIAVSGQLAIDGIAPGKAVPKISGRILLRAVSSRDPGIPGAIVESSVTFANVVPGHYDVDADRFSWMEAGVRKLQNAYLKSIHAGSQDVLRDGLTVDASFERKLTIVLGTDFGRVSGRVLKVSQEPLVGATVALVPDLRSQTSRYGAVLTDASGQFHFDQIAPGSYTIFAWDAVESGAWLNKEFLAGVEGQGRAVVVRGDENASIDLPVIPDAGR